MLRRDPETSPKAPAYMKNDASLEKRRMRQNDMMSKPKFKADIAGGSLKLQESRIIARLLLEKVTSDDWKRAIGEENLLQKRSPGTAMRQASLLRARLQTMGPALWELVAEGSKETATHALFAAAVKHSPLLGEFVFQIVREQFRTFKHELPRKLWLEFIEHLQDQDPEIPAWNTSTVNKLGDTVYQILAEAGYISDTKSYVLQPVQISSDVMAYLREHDEDIVIQRLQVAL